MTSEEFRAWAKKNGLRKERGLDEYYLSKQAVYGKYAICTFRIKQAASGLFYACITAERISPAIIPPGLTKDAFRLDATRDFVFANVCGGNPAMVAQLAASEAGDNFSAITGAKFSDWSDCNYALGKFIDEIRHIGTTDAAIKSSKR